MNSKVNLITGASSDIALAFIKTRLRSQEKIIAHCHRGHNRLAELSESDSFHLIQSDLSTAEGILQMIEQLNELDLVPDNILHLAAPSPRITRFHKMDFDQYLAGQNVMVNSIIQILQNLLPKMTKRKSGKTVFMLTSYVVGPPPAAQAMYTVPKYTLLGLMHSLVAEYATKGLTFNAVSPSMIATRFLHEIHPSVPQAEAKANPTGRLAATDDIVPLLDFLFSDSSDYLNGANIPVTGGSVF